MTTQNFKVLFIQAKNRINKQNQSPIYCRITYHGSRTQFSTGISIEIKHWDAKSQTISKKHPTASQYTYQFEDIKSKLLTSFLICISKKTPFTVLDIYNQYVGKELKKDESVVSYYKSYLAKLKKLIGLQLKESTYNKFFYVGNHLETYVKLDYKKNDIPLDELNEKFLDGFIYYLIVEKQQAQVTINKTIQRFRSAIKQSILEGYLDKDPFIYYKPKKTKKEVVFLSTEELKCLEEHVFQQKKLTLIQDLFIFCCYTGLAYNEMTGLEKRNINVGFDGVEWIEMVREKTQRQISIPLLPKAQAIIEKYTTESNVVLPIISNQKFNSYLKEIAEIVGIEKNLTHHTARKTFASTVLLYNDVPMEIVSELLGHSNMLITQESYGKVVKRKVSQTMQTLSAKLIAAPKKESE